MKQTGAALAVGVFVLLGLGALGYFYEEIGSDKKSDEGYTTFAYFDDVSGLVEGSQVYMRGYAVGRILDISLQQFPDGKTVAKVVMHIDKDVRLREGEKNPATGAWRNGSVVTRRQASLLGEYYLEVLPGVAGPDIGSGGQIHLVETRSGLEKAMVHVEDAAKIIPHVEAVARDIAAITHQARGVFAGEEGEKRLTQMSDDLTNAASDIREVASVLRGFSESSIFSSGKDIDKIIKNAAVFSENAARMSDSAEGATSQILDDFQEVSGTVRELVTGKRSEVERSIGSIKGTLEWAEQVLQKMNSVLEHAEAVAAHVDEGKGTLGRLVRDESLVRDIESVVTDVGDLTGRIRKLQVKWGVRSEYNFVAKEPKSYFTFTLQPTEDKYYRLQLVDDYRGYVSSRTLETTSGGDTVLEEFRETENRLKVSLEFARRYGFFTGRVGLIESSGGLGGDFQFFDDRVAISTDVFDFSAGDNPRLKTWLGLTIIPHVTLVGGVDDYINEETRDFFAGLYLHFTDNDLKALFATTPSVSF